MRNIFGRALLISKNKNSGNTEIYAKEQQIKLIDFILQSLCTLELTSGGRKFLNRLKKKINKDIVRLKSVDPDPENL